MVLGEVELRQDERRNEAEYRDQDLGRLFIEVDKLDNVKYSWMGAHVVWTITYR